MSDHAVTRRRIGSEGEPLVVVDGFAADPDGLRADAIAGSFEAAGHHYPGIRAALPDRYLRDQLPVIAQALRRDFGSCRRIHVVDASFSIVTVAPDELDIRQRLPHVDAYGRDRIALVHYLSASDSGGTAFYRHRTTGFETIDETRAQIFFDTLRGEAEAAPPTGYIAEDTALFERTALIDARFNRALLYRSNVLHSGAIAADAVLSPDPALGRLTVTAFFAIE